MPYAVSFDSSFNRFSDHSVFHNLLSSILAEFFNSLPRLLYGIFVGSVRAIGILIDKDCATTCLRIEVPLNLFIAFLADDHNLKTLIRY